MHHGHHSRAGHLVAAVIVGVADSSGTLFLYGIVATALAPPSQAPAVLAEVEDAKKLVRSRNQLLEGIA